MKKVLAYTLISSILALSLSACELIGDESENSSSSITDSSSSSSSYTSSSSSSSTRERPSDDELIAMFDGELVFPDNTVIPNSEIVGIAADPISSDLWTYLTETAYAGYAAPVFFEDGDPEFDSFAPQTKETELGTVKTVYRDAERSYFIMRGGDVLENGLTVKKAETGFRPDSGSPAFTRVELDGEITLEGILKSYDHTDFEKEFFKDKELVFIPDTVQSGFVPSVYDPGAVCTIINGENGGIVYDGTEYYLPKPLGDPLDGNTSARARVTLKNIRLAFYFTIAYGSTSEAELVNAELI